MLKQVFFHSLRALNRQKGYVLLNIMGLSIGIACSLLIILFITNELSYDKFIPNKERIYRIILNGKIGEQELNVSSTASPIGPTILQEFPEVENFTRVNTWGETIIKNNDISFSVNEYMETDSTFFQIFSFPLIRGDIKTALNAKHKLVLSETTAKKIFGVENPIDKMLKVGNDTALYRVTGIFKDIPTNCSFRINAIGSFVTNSRANDNQWMSNSFETFLLLKENASQKDVDERFSELIKKYIGPDVQKFLGITLEEFLSKGNKYNFYLQPITEIHLNPEIIHGLIPSSDPKYLIIFGIVAILIILVAAINFMNLSTAQSFKRAKEVGIKKVSGSSRMMLIYQFLSESFLLSFGALLVAIILVELALPYFNNLLQTELYIDYFGNWYIIPLLLLLSLVVGVFSGSYPAFILSSFSPYAVLKGKVKEGMKRGILRSVLVILQFSISIILIVGTIIMFRQINFMLNKDLGFKKENLIVISRASALHGSVNAFKESLYKISGVEKISASTAAPSHANNNNGYMMEGRSEETFLLETNWVDYDYLETYGLQLDTGRFFSESYSTDKYACLINETAVKNFNLKSPLSTRFMTRDDENVDSVIYIPVIGVVKDFHIRSLQYEVTPSILRFKTDDIRWGLFNVRISSAKPSETINSIENVWKEFTSNDPLQFTFLDEDFSQQYKEERQNSKLSILFAILAIIIASLGLFGLTSFTIEQRVKEIGVRKAMGATVTSIFLLISKEIMILVALSTIVAWPVIYFVAKNWLQNYHYRINLGVFDFILGFVIAIAIALITISYRTIKTARINPSESLRYE
ncbi:MAG: ABC transporter permease [Tenuifilaceae bacterium]